MKLKFFSADDNGVSGIIAAGVPGDDVGLPGKVAGDLSLPLIPPLGANQNRYRHSFDELT